MLEIGLVTTPTPEVVFEVLITLKPRHYAII